ncbi:hypothetical protein BC829DRAFT_364911, partial [Chytridium lagenaria]
ELFNLRHSVLRNIIQRILGVMKKKYPILCHMRPYNFDVQINLVWGMHGCSSQLHPPTRGQNFR